MLTKDALPIGSIVYLRKSLKKIMITGRLIIDSEKEEQVVFDYSGCEYPKGVVDETILAFNQEDITDVRYRGYSDDDEEELIKRMMEWQEEELGLKQQEEASELEL